MISATGCRRAAALALVLALVAGADMSWAVQARAQTVPGREGAEASEGPEAPAAEAAATETKDSDVSNLELDWSQLNVDASTLKEGPAAKAGAAPRADSGSEVSWSSRQTPSGSALTVKQPLSPFWDTRVGADLRITQQQPSTTSELLANGGSQPQSSGTAWATMAAPGLASIWDKTAIEARVDPSQDRSSLGTSMSKSLPLSEQYSLSLQDGYNVIQQGFVPVPGIPGHPVRNYGTEQSAKLNITDTGTSLIAGQTLSSTDDKWLHKFGAEQRLFDGVSIAASVGETAQGATSKSLTAGFKRSW